MGDHAAEFNAAMERLVRIGPTEALREDERAAGFDPVHPGEREWFSAADWSAGDVVSVRKRIVRIVAIKARDPGKGAFSRLITAIAVAGLTPVIVEPMFSMPDILTRWGWKRSVVGKGFDREEIWMPTVRWLLERSRHPQETTK